VKETKTFIFVKSYDDIMFSEFISLVIELKLKVLEHRYLDNKYIVTWTSNTQPEKWEEIDIEGDIRALSFLSAWYTARLSNMRVCERMYLLDSTIAYGDEIVTDC